MEINARRARCRKLLETTEERVRVQGTCPHHGNPVYIGDVEIWGFRPAAITSKLLKAVSPWSGTEVLTQQTALSDVTLTQWLSWSQRSTIKAGRARPAHSKALQRWRLKRTQPMQQESIWKRWLTKSLEDLYTSHCHLITMRYSTPTKKATKLQCGIHSTPWSKLFLRDGEVV